MDGDVPLELAAAVAVLVLLVQHPVAGEQVGVALAEQPEAIADEAPRLGAVLVAGLMPPMSPASIMLKRSPRVQVVRRPTIGSTQCLLGLGGPPRVDAQKSGGRACPSARCRDRCSGCRHRDRP